MKQTRVEGEDQDYLLNIGNHSGTAGDFLISGAGPHDNIDGMKFSTKDRNNDKTGNWHCALHLGAWWHNRLVASQKNQIK